MKKVFRLLSLSLALLFALATLVACNEEDVGEPADTPERAKEALQGNGYVVTMTEDPTLLDYDGMLATVYAYKGENVITIHYFDSAANANAAWSGLKKDGYVCKKSDSRIWIATSAAVVKDAR